MISVGACVIAWIAVLIALSRDQVLARLAALQAELTVRAEEYGELRETDGYLRAMRTAGLPTPEVRALHRVPPPASAPE